MSGKNYAKGAPMGDNQVPFTTDAPPAVAALGASTRNTAATAAVSSIVVLNENTTAIEVGASGGPGFIKWLSQSVVDSSVAGTSVIVAAGGTANFDHMIPTDNVRRFVIPIATIPSSQTSVMGANRANGLYPNVAIVGVSSVLLTQYGSSNSY